MLRKEEKYDILISVEDTGVGIDQDQQALIFESFRQQDGQSNRKYGGTGLGLTITKRLVEMMNGEISLKSTVGKGSIFAVTLYNVESTEKDRILPPVFSGKLFEAAKVLIVDDIEANRLLFKGFLLNTGLEVIEAENGKHALTAVEKKIPQVVFMDIKMPGMDGYQTLKRLKASTAENIPVVAFTASKTDEEKSKIEQAGFAGCLFKPVTRSSVLIQLMRFIPYVATEPDEQTDEDKQKIEFGEIKHRSELIQRLTDEMLPIREKLKGAIEIDIVEDFARQLAALAKEHNALELLDYAESLFHAVQNFEIDNIQIILGKFQIISQEITRMEK
ncbi:MAG: response regulator [Candidatus Electrothrix sp. AR3]|nr:response regulator [Candidatus Electrothrix sp. AR3]